MNKKKIQKKWQNLIFKNIFYLIWNLKYLKNATILTYYFFNTTQERRFLRISKVKKCLYSLHHTILYCTLYLRLIFTQIGLATRILDTPTSVFRFSLRNIFKTLGIKFILHRNDFCERDPWLGSVKLSYSILQNESECFCESNPAIIKFYIMHKIK